MNAIKLESARNKRDIRNGLRTVSIINGKLKDEIGYVVQFAPSKSYSKGDSFVALIELSNGKFTSIPVEDIQYRDKIHGLRPVSIIEGELKGEKGYIEQFAPSKSYSKGDSFVALVELPNGRLTSISVEDIQYDDVI